MLPHKNRKIGTPYKKRGYLWSLGWHTGDDWLTPTGDPAYAMADGVVRATGYNGSYGNHVIVETNVGGVLLRWSENHLSKIKVKTGQKVKGGQLLGYTGATGHVTGPHDHVEARRSPFTFTPSAFVDPQVLYDWQPVSKRPTWATLRPSKAPARWYREAFLNVGGMNAAGRKTLRKRAPKIVREFVKVKADVVGVAELPDGDLDFFTDLMVEAGFRRVCGTDGRYIFRLAKTASRVDYGTFDLQPRYDGDDKQAAWAVLMVNGNLALVVVGHLESDPPADDERVGQALDMIRQAEAKAARHDMSKSRISYMVDTNSDTWVRVQAFNEKHYVDAAETAWKRSYATTATFLGWGGKAKIGARIDGIFVHRVRPVRYYTTRRKATGLSDHLMIVADVGMIEN